jgi:hypothetical protein
MVCPSATSKAEARWLRFGLVVVATTSRRDDKDQMIRPLELLPLLSIRGGVRGYREPVHWCQARPGSVVSIAGALLQ